MSELGAKLKTLGAALSNPRYEMLATIPGGDGKNHWINIYKLVSFSRLNWFGGKTATAQTIGYWDPATGLTSSTSFLLLFKVFMF